jgi:hypothetical protein
MACVKTRPDWLASSVRMKEETSDSVRVISKGSCNLFEESAAELWRCFCHLMGDFSRPKNKEWG